jgi:hypothetical protein
MTDNTVTTFPMLPTYGTSLEWDENCILRKPWKQRLRSGSCRILSGPSFINSVVAGPEMMSSRKRRRGITDKRSNTPQADDIDLGVAGNLLSMSQSQAAVPELAEERCSTRSTSASCGG